MQYSEVIKPSFITLLTFCLGEERASELENLVLRIEGERDQLAQQLTLLQQQLAARDLDRGSLDTRLGHRSAQLSQLQEQLTAKISQNSALERQVMFNKWARVLLACYRYTCITMFWEEYYIFDSNDKCISSSCLLNSRPNTMYCQSGNICDFLIFTNFVRTIFLIQQSRKEVIQMISI